MWSGRQLDGISWNLLGAEKLGRGQAKQNCWEAELEISRGLCWSLSINPFNKLQLLELLLFTDYKKIQEFVKYREAKVRKLKLLVTQRSPTTNILTCFLPLLTPLG